MGNTPDNLPNFSNNPLFFNPAYAGSSGTLGASILHYRGSNLIGSQDNVSLLSVSSPIGKGNWSLGGNLMHNNTSYIDVTGLDGIVAYNKRFKNGGKLSLGALASLERNHIEATFNTSPSGDPLVFDDAGFNPQFGLGALYETKRGYLSFSSTDLFEVGWTYEDENGTEYYGSTQSDYYLSGGLNFEVLSGKLKILPTATYYKVFNNELIQPNSSDLELGTSVVLSDKIWLGGGYRFSLNGLYASNYNTGNAWAGVNLKNGLRVSGEIGWTVSALTLISESVYGGIMLGYRMSKDNEHPYLGRRNFF